MIGWNCRSLRTLVSWRWLVTCWGETNSRFRMTSKSRNLVPTIHNTKHSPTDRCALRSPTPFHCDVISFFLVWQVLVLLDMTPDQSMLDEGLAREIINRLQKARKKVGVYPYSTVFYPYKHWSHFSLVILRRNLCQPTTSLFSTKRVATLNGFVANWKISSWTPSNNH